MIASPQSFGSLLVWHPHVHALIAVGIFDTDGVFHQDLDIDFGTLEEELRQNFLLRLLRRGTIDDDRYELLRSWEHSGFSDAGDTAVAVVSVFALGNRATLSFPEESEVLEFTFSVEVAPDEDPLETNLEICDEGQTGNFMLVPSGGEDPDRESDVTGDPATITLMSAFPQFLRGDANSDGEVSALGDGLYLLNWGFVDGAGPLLCDAAADADGDGVVSALFDAFVLLKWGFRDGPPPPTPGPEECGPEPESELTCGTVIKCP